MERRQKMNV